MRKSRIWLLAALLTLAVGMYGCSGDDGSNGAQGPEGEQGPAGPVTTTNESCVVCHGAGKLADVSDAVATGTHYIPALPQVAVTVNSVTVDAVTDPANPVISTTFTPTASAALDAYAGGLGYASATSNNLSYLRFAYARLNAAGQWVRYTSGDRDKTHLTDNLDGSFTMDTPIAGADYAADMPTRLLLLVSAVADQTAPLNVIYNFVPDGTTSTISRDVVAESACNSCHGNLEANGNGISGIHGGARYLVAACVVCHADRANSASGTQGISVGREMAYFIHAIHSGANLLDDPDVIRGRDDWSEVTYPENIKNCQKCHTGTADADNYLVASRLACSGCHVTVNFATGENHPGGIQTTDTFCSGCHPATGTLSSKSVTQAHDTTPTNVPEFNIAITLSAPANGTYYEAGEEPVVTIVLSDPTSGNPVDHTVAFSKKDTTGNNDGILSGASLYVYGPRANMKPVLTPAVGGTGSTAGNNLLAVDPARETVTAGSVTYKLDAIPEGMAAGTYMVRFEGGDYGRISADDYRAATVGLTHFQVGTADEEPKVAGDNCVNCHGNTIMHVDRHNAPFDTDHCGGCHDYYDPGTLAATGGWGGGQPLSRRVHAVHSASATADTHSGTSPQDWSEVAFPQNVKRCATCHSDGTTYRTKPSEIPCMGCHSDPLMVDHMRQNGGQYQLLQ